MSRALLLDRVKQRTLDVIDLGDGLLELLPHDASLREDVYSTCVRLLRCLTLLEERPCASWALEELSGKAARLGCVFSLARRYPAVGEDRETEGLSLCADLIELARAAERSSLLAPCTSTAASG